MTIAYGIALRMGWDQPMWAGFAVAMISLSSIGQSINKATLRMLGTLVAVVAALTVISLFSQDRWLFMVFLSAWVGLCTYMMGGSRNQYFWHVSAFTCVIICMDGGFDPVNAFNTAMLRTQETGLGILVYSLIAIFLWPTSSRASFDVVTGKLASAQQQLFQSYFELMQGKADSEDADALRGEVIQQQGQFIQLLDAAKTDSYEVGEQRQQWENYRDQVVELNETMARWRESFIEVQTLDLPRLLPSLPAFGAELSERLTQVSRMLAGDAPAQSPQTIDLSFDEDVLVSLSSFHRAAITVMRLRLQHLERLTRSLYTCISTVKGFAPAVTPAEKSDTPAPTFVLDPDRLAAVVRVVVMMWMAWLAVIYVDGIPGGAGLISMAVPLTMALANMPYISVSQLFIPASVSVLFASLVYIFIMPQLSSFYSLSLLIFAITFSVCYLFSAPGQALGRVFGLAMFVAIASISNEQTYSFMTVANTALMLALVFLFIMISAYIPFSPRPERAFQRLLRRFFHSCQYLISTSLRDTQRPVTRLDRLKKAFHAREVSTLPTKLGTWGKFIDTGPMSDKTPQQIQAIVTSTQALTYRVKELLEIQDDPQAAYLVQELRDDMQAWRRALQTVFQRLAQDPAVGQHEVLLEKMKQVLHTLEERIEVTMASATRGQINQQEGESFYRLLGAYRGLSEALVDYSGSTDVIDWAPWREEKFA